MFKNLKLFFTSLIDSKNYHTLLLILLLSADFVFIAVHCLNIYGVIGRNNLYSIVNENGYSEIFQYLKEFWVFIIMFHLFIKKKSISFLIWSLLFLYILLDDSLTIHETLGEYLAKYFDLKPRFKLRGEDYGELIVSFIVGGCFIVALILAYLKSKTNIQKISQHLFTFLLVLAFFGIFLDMIHVFYNDNHKLGLLEDGGEMLVMSFIMAYTFNLLNILVGSKQLS